MSWSKMHLNTKTWQKISQSRTFQIARVPSIDTVNSMALIWPALQYRDFEELSSKEIDRRTEVDCIFDVLLQSIINCFVGYPLY